MEQRKTDSIYDKTECFICKQQKDILEAVEVACLRRLFNNDFFWNK